MKNWFLLLVLLFWVFNVIIGQPSIKEQNAGYLKLINDRSDSGIRFSTTLIPEKIWPLSRAIKSLDYYQAQSELWKQILEVEPNRPNAWLNFYLAARNVNLLSSSSGFDLEQIAKSTKEIIPETFEQLYITFLQSPSENKDYKALLKAHNLAPKREELLVDLIAYHEIKGNQNKTRHYCKRLHQSGQLPNGLLDWNYNALMSTKENGILFTQGVNDTYPAIVLQKVLGIRPDVRVVNLNLLSFEKTYGEHLFLEENIPPISAEVAFPFDNSERLYALLLHIIHNTNKPIYFGVAIAEQLRKESANELYLTGLTFKHSDTSFDNVALIKDNFEHKFRLDNLERSIDYHFGQSVVDQMNMNYIPAFVMLHDAYQNNGQLENANQIKAIAELIADRIGQKALVDRFFQAPIPPPSIEIEGKDLVSGMVSVPGLKDTYASDIELSNEQYYLFLKDLLNQGLFEQFEKYSIEPTNWKASLPAGFGSLPDEELFEHGHPEDPRMPVVNISYEAAEQYCKWRTNAYNASESKYKLFKKVEFYIPTEKEWIIAARGGHEQSPYPWGGYYFKNAKGSVLANVNLYFSEYDSIQQQFVKGSYSESPGADQIYTLGPAGGYFPNNFGLYNVAGNAAEMVQERAFTLGGSWLDPVHYVQIGERHYRELPNPAVGVRVFMKVLEWGER